MSGITLPTLEDERMIEVYWDGKSLKIDHHKEKDHWEITEQIQAQSLGWA